MSQVPCKTCGESTSFTGSKLCSNCWEVEKRLEKYLQSPGGRKWVQSKMPVLDDWVDGHPDAWDYEAVLTENKVQVEWCDTIINGVTGERRPNEFCAGWTLLWKSGVIHIGNTTETIARKAAALFVSLWQRRVSASFADKLMDGFIVFLERQEGITKGFVAKAERRMTGCLDYLCLCLGTFGEEDRLLKEFGLKEGDSVGVTLSKLQEK